MGNFLGRVAAVANTPTPPSANDLAHAQIKRLLNADAFRHSETQRRLLSYLAEKSLVGEAEALKEYTIGVEVLGRAEDYDPSRDSSVRMQVARLREKIANYYRTEGMADPIRVDLPKGHFKMVFQERPTDPHPAKTVLTARTPAIWLAAVALITLGWTARWWAASLFGWESEGGHALEAWTPALEATWQPFLASNRPILISLGTPLFFEVPSIGYFRLPELDDRADWQGSDRVSAVMRAFPGLNPRALYGFTGVGEARGAFELAKLLGTRRQDLRLVRSNLLSWDEIAISDVIFVGPPKFNVQLKEIPVDQEFVLESNGIRNLRPQPGEPPFLESRDTADRLALITRIPGLHGEGQILIFASNVQPGTLAAIQYMTQRQGVEDLHSRIRTGTGTLPRYYQVILKVQVKDMTPVHVAYLSHRILKTKQ